MQRLCLNTLNSISKVLHLSRLCSRSLVRHSLYSFQDTRLSWIIRVTPGRSRAEQLQETTRGDAANRSSRRNLARRRIFAGIIEGEFNEAGEWFAFLVGTTLPPFVHHSLSCFKPTRLTAWWRVKRTQRRRNNHRNISNIYSLYYFYLHLLNGQHVVRHGRYEIIMLLLYYYICKIDESTTV